jgi:hypothetical protein
MAPLTLPPVLLPRTLLALLLLPSRSLPAVGPLLLLLLTAPQRSMLTV